MLLEKDLIDPEVFAANMRRITEGIKPVVDETDKMLKKIKDAVDGFAREFTDTLVDGLAEGELAFDEFAESVLKTIAKMVLNELFTQFFSAIVGTYGGDGILGAFGGASARTLHVSQQEVLPTARTRGGGAALHNVVTSGMITSGGRSRMGGGVNVVVNNNAPVDVEARESRDDQGNVNIELLIERQVNQSIYSGGLDKAMRSNYGVARRAF